MTTAVLAAVILAPAVTVICMIAPHLREYLRACRTPEHEDLTVTRER